MSRPGPDEIAIALADALPRNASRRSELVALGMVTTAVIAAANNRADQAELVEVFCGILRRSVAAQMN